MGAFCVKFLQNDKTVSIATENYFQNVIIKI
jgi:hypothetical protein